MNRATIKQQGKALISSGKWATIFFSYVFAMICISAIPVIISSVFGAMTALNENVSMISLGLTSAVSIIFGIITVAFTVSGEGMFVRFIRNPQLSFGDCFSHIFKNAFSHFLKYMWTVILSEIVIFLWSILFVIPGIIAAYRYRYVYQIIHDNPTLSAGQAMSASAAMTKGRKGELFLLDLSYIPWFLLMPLTLGIISIWLVPYIQTVNALYYENLRLAAIEEGKVNVAVVNPVAYPAPQVPMDYPQQQNPAEGPEQF